MNHLDDGTLQAFLDDELPPQERANAAEHLLSCRRCRTAKDELVRAHSVFSEAVSVLDVDAPARSAPVGPGRRFRVSGLVVKAASLTLLLAAAASAAVPGSPVRAWIARTVNPEPGAGEVPVMETVEPAPAPAPVPAGVSLAATGDVQIVLTALEGSTVRLVETDGERVTVSTVGADTDPAFRTAPHRIEVRGAVGGEITVELPRSLETARLVVDGRVYAEKAAGELRVRVPAETVKGTRIWR